ncbi:MAG: hypothetical protein ACK5W7_14205, partial [Gemmatimonadaceae bacterium]
MIRPAAHRLLLLPATLAMATAIAERVPVAQPPARLDVGSFTILLNGQRVGREQFSVQRVDAGDGATLELRAESSIGDRRSAMRLEADSAGTPVRYSV